MKKRVNKEIEGVNRVILAALPIQTTLVRKFVFFLQRNSTLKGCKFVTNVWYVKNTLANCDGNLYLPILHLPTKGRNALQVARKIASCDGPLAEEAVI